MGGGGKTEMKREGRRGEERRGGEWKEIEGRGGEGREVWEEVRRKSRKTKRGKRKQEKNGKL